MGDITFTVKGGVEMTVPAAVINEGFSDEIYTAIFTEGLKVIAAKGMTGIKATETEKIKAKAAENLKALEEGKVPGRTAAKAKAKGLPKAVMSLAMKLAREEVNILLTRAGRKPANCDAKEKTRLSREYLELPEYGPAVLAKATAMVAEFEAKADQVASALNLDAVQEDPHRVKLAKDRAARAKESKATKSPTPMRRGRDGAEHRPSA
jgi:hypothetical protein